MLSEECVYPGITAPEVHVQTVVAYNRVYSGTKPPHVHVTMREVQRNAHKCVSVSVEGGHTVAIQGKHPEGTRPLSQKCNRMHACVYSGREFPLLRKSSPVVQGVVACLSAETDCPTHLATRQ